MRSAATVLLAAMLPGCIVQEIRDEIKGVNAKLVTVDQGLASTNAQLEQVNQRLSGVGGGLDATNVKLKDVETGLGRIDATNQSLGSVQERLALLASIEKSLTHLDVHLAALRTTIGKLDSAIPFLDLGGGGTVETPAPAPTAAPITDGAAPQPTEPATAATPARDPLVGAWIAAHPGDKEALVFLADGRLLSSAGPGSPAQRGKWSRTGSALTLEFDEIAQPPQPNSPPGSPPRAVKPPTRTFEIAHQGARSLSLIENGSLLIYARP